MSNLSSQPTYGIITLVVVILACWVVGKLPFSRHSKAIGVFVGLIATIFFWRTRGILNIEGLQISLVDKVPYAVAATYVEIKPADDTSLHSYLEKCHNNDGTVFHVFDSRGFVSNHWYFDKSGKLLATFQDSDVHGPGYTGPPITISDCGLILGNPT